MAVLVGLLSVLLLFFWFWFFWFFWLFWFCRIFGWYSFGLVVVLFFLILIFILLLLLFSMLLLFLVLFDHLLRLIASLCVLLLLLLFGRQIGLFLFGLLVAFLFLADLLDVFLGDLDPLKVVVHVFDGFDRLIHDNFSSNCFFQGFNSGCSSCLEDELNCAFVDPSLSVSVFEYHDYLVLLDALRLLQHLVDYFIGVYGHRFHGFVRLSPDSAEHVVSLYLS